MNDRLVNAFGLARVLKLPAAWLIKEAEAGRIPCLRVGRKRRFNAEAVRRLLAKRAAVAAVAPPEPEKPAPGIIMVREGCEGARKR